MPSFHTPRPIIHPGKQPVYHTVSEGELCRIEETCGRPRQELTVVTISLPIFAATIVPLLTLQLDETGKWILLFVTISSGIVAVLKGFDWWKIRNDGPAVIKSIRERAREKNDPDPS